MEYQLWVSEDRTILVRQWENGKVEIAQRPNSWETWGPPVELQEEAIPSPTGTA